ncbi:MAG: NAD-dependent epimerase/dehydratase family protein [Planctomycetota bacterium]|nr:NAD-dependent epimerase/dehydratase family protein [Planctomycetota bacterium]
MNLITGATGLLGSHIAEQLVAAGQRVRVLVRGGSDTKFLDSLGVEKAPGDVTDAASLAAAFEGVERVYHAAAQVGDWGPWDRYVAVTIQGTANMLAAAKKARVKRFLQVSSISAYGHPDGAGLVLDETAPLGVNLHKWSYYSRAKVEAEKLAWAAHAAGDVPVTVVKPSWLYGPRDRASMPRLIRAIRAGKAKLIGDGTNRLNLTHAANEAEGCILAATTEKALGQNYNLSNDGVITQGEYLNAIAAAVGAGPVTKKVPYKVARSAAFLFELFGHLFACKKPPLVTRYAVWLMGRRCFFSCEKARRELNWQPRIGYEKGIPEAVGWCLKNVDMG